MYQLELTSSLCLHSFLSSCQTLPLAQTTGTSTVHIFFDEVCGVRPPSHSRVIRLCRIFLSSILAAFSMTTNKTELLRTSFLFRRGGGRGGGRKGTPGHTQISGSLPDTRSTSSFGRRLDSSTTKNARNRNSDGLLSPRQSTSSRTQASAVIEDAA